MTVEDLITYYESRIKALENNTQIDYTYRKVTLGHYKAFVENLRRLEVGTKG